MNKDTKELEVFIKSEAGKMVRDVQIDLLELILRLWNGCNYTEKESFDSQIEELIELFKTNKE
jgi:hypothetical protein